MYTDWFQLAHKPFAIAPDPRFLFLSERHREALAHLLFGVNEGGGFIQLTGEVGTGKTTLTRTLMQQLPDNVDAALIFNPRVSLTEFLELICDELRVALPAGERTPKLLTDALNRHLLDSHARGRRTVLVIDEAQNLDPDLLEQVRLLTNLETDRDKLLQIVLVGQPELRDTLARRELRQLAQRITARFHLDPLDAEETAAYVRHRLEVAGARRQLFPRAAIRAVHAVSGGVPRLINIICDRALLGAWANRVDRVDAAMVRRAAREVQGDTRRRPLALASAVSVMLLAAAGTLAWHLHGGVTETATAVVERADPATEPAPEPAQVQPGPPSLVETLAEAGTTMPGAAAELLSMWEIQGDDALPASLCRLARASGLDCLRDRGDWRKLRELNRPALLELVAYDGQSHTVLLKALGERDARIMIGEQAMSYPLEDIGAMWYGEYLALWDTPVPAGSLLRAGSAGTAVARLRELLDHALGSGGETGRLDNYFDDGLVERVREFQAQAGIEVDGIAGEQTLLHLDRHSPAGPRIVTVSRDVADT